MNISIFGLGYVGSVCAGCLSGRGHQVTACDVQRSKVDAINAGVSPICEPGLEALIRAGRETGRLVATTDTRQALAKSELSLLCVGTPSRSDGSVDTSSLERVCQDIRDAVKASGVPHTVVVRSTVAPDAFHARLLPLLTEGGTDGLVRVCCNPEFLRESTAVSDFENPPLIVIGEHRPGNGDRLVAMYEGYAAPLRRMAISEALMVKYASNAFHALKIAFANEIGSLCQALEADSHEVMSAFCEERQLNISHRYLKPGGAFGGSCLPKDLRALQALGRSAQVNTPLLSAASESNRQLIERSIAAIVASGLKRVGFLGLSFKDDTDDLRESPTLEIVERLVGKGFAVSIHDKDVASSRIFGSNLGYVDQHVPHLASLLRPTMDEVLAGSDLVVLAKPSQVYRGVAERLRPGQQLLDLIRFLPRNGAEVANVRGLVG